MVFVYHAWWRAGNPEVHWGRLDLGHAARALDAGVCIFFVLSGFLLSAPFWRAIDTGAAPRPWRDYLARRAARILPAYVLVLLVLYLPAPYLRTPYGLLEFLLHATCLQTFTDFAYTSRVDPVLWSIGIEFQFYLLLPFGMALARRAYARAGTAGALAALWLAIAGLDLAARGTFHALAGHVPNGIVATHDSALPGGTVFGYLKWFGAGITAAAWFVTRPPTPGGSRRADVVAIGAALLAVVVVLRGGEHTWQTVAPWGWPLNTAVFAVLVAALPRTRWLGRLLETRVLRVLGDVSYGVYLWHWPIQVAVFPWLARYLPDGTPPLVGILLACAISLALTLAVATMSWRWVEQPVLRRVRGRRAASRSVD